MFSEKNKFLIINFRKFHLSRQKRKRWETGNRWSWRFYMIIDMPPNRSNFLYLRNLTNIVCNFWYYITQINICTTKCYEIYSINCSPISLRKSYFIIFKILNNRQAFNLHFPVLTIYNFYIPRLYIYTLDTLG